jgi:UDP-glucose 6-dehydrogenase
MAESFYQQVINRVVRMSSPRAAEMTKLFENVFRVVNVAVVNELAILCDRMGLNVWEIVDAAATKPYGFMSFYPGPGVGGHCLSENELLFVKNGHGLTCVRIGDYFAQLEYQYPGVARKVTGVTILEPEGIDILSFDLERREACYKPLQALSRREYRGTMVDIATDDRRSLCVTDGHPMVVWTANLPQIKRASDLRPGDELIVPTQWPDVVSIHQEIDLISHLAADEIGRTRVVPKHGHFKDYRAQLTLHLKALDIDPHEIYRSNRMPLRVYLELEQCNTMPITRRDIMLRTGHGSSWNAISAVIAIDEEFARLIGYYLSEGCITTDKSLRTRFVFNSNEREYIDDVCHILGKLGLRYSKRKDKVWNALHIKVSSNLFARLIRDVLGCGTCSTEMQIPGVLLGSPEPIRLALLSGLLRGDGDVDLEQQTRHYYYKKKQRFYDHSINVATVGYFSSSPRLFQQTVALAQGLGFVPTFKKNKPYLRFYGQHQLARLLSLFEGAKRADLESYARNRRKQMPTKSFTAHGNFATVKIRQISQTEGAHNVYSAEVEDTHTFVTSYGIVTHNCIPVDPFYLTWKARQYDFNTRFIELAGETNLMMPYQVRERVIRALNWQGRALNGAKVLILGVAYKRDIADVRESPAFKVIELLRRDGVEVVYNDPHVPEFQHSDLAMRSVPLTDELLASADCVLILTDHRAYDYDSIVANARVLVDTRNATKGVKRNREKIVLL